MNLLIVEDEIILLEKYSEYLTPLFDEIHTCTTLEKALESTQSKAFNVALIDYNLPDGNGLDLIKSYPELDDTPVSVMITAYSKETIAIQSLNLGVYKYLEKPVKKEELVLIMKKAADEAKKRDSLDRLTNQFIVSTYAKSILVNEHFMTNREVEVLENILIYTKNNNVAVRLNISQGTVRNHLSNIFQKLHIHSKDELKKIIEKLNSKQ